MPSSDSSPCIKMNPGCKRGEMVHGDESPDAINRVPTDKTAHILLKSLIRSLPDIRDLVTFDRALRSDACFTSRQIDKELHRLRIAQRVHANSLL